MESRIADKLTLVMKALAVSRGQLASQLAVDKSIVAAGCPAPICHPERT
jgi:hypothetical protein